MKLTELYKKKGTPFVTLSITFICILASLAVFIWPDLFNVLCLKTSPKNIWQYASGIFIHGITPRWFMWVHLIMNLCALVPFGILIEKVFGSKKTLFFFLVEWLVTIIIFQAATMGGSHEAAGISSIGYTFATLAFYITYLLWKQNKKAFWKQPLAYYFAFEFLGMLSLLNPIQGMVSFLLHLSGLIIGIFFVATEHTNLKSKVYQ